VAGVQELQELQELQNGNGPGRFLARSICARRRPSSPIFAVAAEYPLEAGFILQLL
jgi:hypothetical protein